MKLQIIAMFLKTYVFVDHGTLYLFCVVVYLLCLSKSDNVLFFFLLFNEQIEMIYKIIEELCSLGYCWEDHIVPETNCLVGPCLTATAALGTLVQSRAPFEC